MHLSDALVPWWPDSSPPPSRCSSSPPSRVVQLYSCFPRDWPSISWTRYPSSISRSLSFWGRFLGCGIWCSGPWGTMRAQRCEPIDSIWWPPCFAVCLRGLSRSTLRDPWGWLPSSACLRGCESLCSIAVVITPCIYGSTSLWSWGHRGGTSILASRWSSRIYSSTRWLIAINSCISIATVRICDCTSSISRWRCGPDRFIGRRRSSRPISTVLASRLWARWTWSSRIWFICWTALWI